MLSDNRCATFPGAWGELAELLRQTHLSLDLAGAAGAPGEDVVALSRAARQAVRRAGSDIDRAVAEVARLAGDARALAASVP